MPSISAAIPPYRYSGWGLPTASPRTKLTVGGGVSAQSKTKSLYNVKQGGYGLIDGFVQYEFGPHAKLNLIGTNLADRTYFENNANRTRGMNNFYGEPRTVSLKLDWKF